MSQHVTKSIFSFFTTAGKLGLAGFALSASLSFDAIASDAQGQMAPEAQLVVTLNKTQILHLPGAATAIVVGNPDIADISVHSPDTLFIVGRGYGQTNLIALDGQGQTILVADITVKNSNSLSGVRIINIGEGQQSYNCTTQCLPSPTLGDAPAFIGSFTGQGMAINNASTSPVSGGMTPQMQNTLNATEAFDEPDFEEMGQSVRDEKRLNADY